MSVDMLLLIIAAVCFAAAAFFSTRFAQFNLVAAGLFFWILTNII